jgi:hypothetical protein
MRISRFLAVITAILLVTAAAFGQSSVSGSLTGTVTSDGTPLPGATVTITSPSLQGSRTAVSDANGNCPRVTTPSTCHWKACRR